MAWNQPSGPNNQWGRRPGQGGPDLDERLKSWQKKLESLLRPGGRGGDSGSLLLLAVAVVFLIWLWTGVYQVKQSERGVVQRFGRYIETTLPGLHFRMPWPIESVSIVNVASVNSNDFKSRVLTSDLNLVDLHFGVQYEFANPVDKLFKVRDPESALSEVAESAIREIVGRSTLEELLAGATRPDITRRTKDLIQRVLNYYNAGIRVSTVNLIDVQVPEAVAASQRDANKAEADKERFILEAEADVNRILPVAEGAAARIAQDAQAYKSQVTAIAEGRAARFSQLEAAYEQAPDVTRRRMYMDTVEALLARAHKVLIDSHSSNNLIYLPIDKILEKSVNREVEQTPEASSGASKDQDQVTIEARSRGER
jgi:modulator of FtsH protease HflK